MTKTKIIAALFSLCIFLPAAAQDTEPQRQVLIKAKAVSSNKYLIIARGYPRPGLTVKLQMQGTAKEAALLNAQILAKERFVDGFDVIRNGKAEKYIVTDEYADVYYYLQSPGIRRYLKK
ncbi:MAG: hypothetical protein ACRCUT_05645 [Spirochaetota bacterium]